MLENRSYVNNAINNAIYLFLCIYHREILNGNQIFNKL